MTSNVNEACDALGITKHPFLAVNAATIATPLPPVPYVVPGLGLARSCAPNCFGGYGFSRKTLAAQDLALAVATGGKVWGRFDCVQCPVLHIDYEQGSYLTSQRYQRIARERGIDLASLGDRLRLACAPPAYLDSEQIEDHLIALIQENDAGLVIIDSLKAATPNLDENGSSIRIPLDMLLRVSVRTNSCVVVIHHAKKPSKDDAGGRKTMLRGSSAIFDACSSVLTFTSDEGEPTEIGHAKNRWSGNLVEPFYLDSEDTQNDAGLRIFVRDDLSESEPPWMLTLQSKILEIVSTNPGQTQTVILSQVSGNAARKSEAFKSLVGRHIIKLIRNKGYHPGTDSLLPMIPRFSL